MQLVVTYTKGVLYGVCKEVVCFEYESKQAFIADLEQAVYNARRHCQETKKAWHDWKKQEPEPYYTEKWNQWANSEPDHSWTFLFLGHKFPLGCFAGLLENGIHMPEIMELQQWFHKNAHKGDNPCP